MYTVKQLCEILRCCSQGNCLICSLANEKETDACNEILRDVEEILRKQYEQLSKMQSQDMYVDGLQGKVVELKKALADKQAEVDALSAKLRETTVEKIKLENKIKKML